MQLAAAAAVAGAAGTTATGTAAADGSDCDSPHWARESGMVTCMQYQVADAGSQISSALAFAAGSIITDENPQPTADLINLHHQAVGAGAWWDHVQVMIDSGTLQFAAQAAHIASRDGIADAWEDGASVSGGRDAALNQIADYYSVPARNASEAVASACVEVAYAAAVAREDDDISDTFVNCTIANDDYDGDGDADGPGEIKHDGDSDEDPSFKKVEIDLPNGEPYEVRSPRFVQEWDNGDSIEYRLDDILEHYDADEDEIVLESEDGFAVDVSNVAIAVNNVPDTDLSSKGVFRLVDWAETMDEIDHQNTEVRANYDSTLVDKIYDALDDGDIDPSDVRGVAGMAEYLSGSTDVTSERFQMALMNMLDLSRNDLSEIASMTLEYDGFTARNIVRSDSGGVDWMGVEDYEEGLEIEGQLFARLGDDTTVSSGDRYITNPIVVVGTVNDAIAFDAIDGSELWSHPYSHTHVVMPSRDGSLIYVAGTDDDPFIAVDATDGSEAWAADIDDTHPAYAIAESDDVVYVGTDGDVVHAIDTDDGSVIWDSETLADTVFGLVVDDDRLFAVSGGAAYELDASTGSVEWSADGYTDFQGLALADDVLVAIDGGAAYGLDPDDGSEKWDVSLPGDGNDVVGTAYTAIVGCDGGHLVALDPADGSEKWQSSLAEDVNGVALSPDHSTVFGSFEDELHALDVDDGSEKWVTEYDTGDLVRGAGAAPVTVDGMLSSASGFDVPSGTEYQLVNGIVEVVEMTDTDGNVVDEDEEYEWDEPQHDSGDMGEYRDYVTVVTEEHVTVIREEEEDDEDPIGFPSFGDFLDGSLLGLGIIAVAVMAVISVVTDAIPILGD